MLPKQEISDAIRNKRIKQAPRKKQESSKVINLTKKNRNKDSKPIIGNITKTEVPAKRNSRNSVVWQVCSVPNRKKDRNAVQPAVCQCGFRYENYIPNNGLSLLKKHVENNCPVYKSRLEEKEQP